MEMKEFCTINVFQQICEDIIVTIHFAENASLSKIRSFHLLFNFCNYLTNSHLFHQTFVFPF